MRSMSPLGHNMVASLLTDGPVQAHLTALSLAYVSSRPTWADVCSASIHLRSHRPPREHDSGFYIDLLTAF
jgi:hypothetical protein